MTDPIPTVPTTTRIPETYWTTKTITTIPEAHLEIITVLTDTLAWAFDETEEGDERPADWDERLLFFQNLADLLVTDLGLTVVGVEADGTIRAELRLTEADETD